MYMPTKNYLRKMAKKFFLTGQIVMKRQSF